MKISSRFTVAVHSLAVIKLTNDCTCTSEYIASSVNTNPVVIRRILGMLKKTGIIEVKAGLGGAYLLREASDITLLDVYRAVEVVEEDELFQFHSHPNEKCPIGKNIEDVLGFILKRAQHAMEAVLKEVTLEDVVNDLIEHK